MTELNQTTGGDSSLTRPNVSSRDELKVKGPVCRRRIPTGYTVDTLFGRLKFLNSTKERRLRQTLKSEIMSQAKRLGYVLCSGPSGAKILVAENKAPSGYKLDKLEGDSEDSDDDMPELEPVPLRETPKEAPKPSKPPVDLSAITQLARGCVASALQAAQKDAPPSPPKYPPTEEGFDDLLADLEGKYDDDGKDPPEPVPSISSEVKALVEFVNAKVVKPPQVASPPPEVKPLSPTELQDAVKSVAEAAKKSLADILPSKRPEDPFTTQLKTKSSLPEPDWYVASDGTRYYVPIVRDLALVLEGPMLREENPARRPVLMLEAALASVRHTFDYHERIKDGPKIAVANLPHYIRDGRNVSHALYAAQAVEWALHTHAIALAAIQPDASFVSTDTVGVCRRSAKQAAQRLDQSFGQPHTQWFGSLKTLWAKAQNLVGALTDSPEHVPEYELPVATTRVSFAHAPVLRDGEEDALGPVRDALNHHSYPVPSYRPF